MYYISYYYGSVRSHYTDLSESKAIKENANEMRMI
jgi:hypothetical protein